MKNCHGRTLNQAKDAPQTPQHQETASAEKVVAQRPSRARGRSTSIRLSDPGEVRPILWSSKRPTVAFRPLPFLEAVALGRYLRAHLHFPSRIIGFGRWVRVGHRRFEVSNCVLVLPIPGIAGLRFRSPLARGPASEHALMRALMHSCTYAPMHLLAYFLHQVCEGVVRTSQASMQLRHTATRLRTNF